MHIADVLVAIQYIDLVLMSEIQSSFEESPTLWDIKGPNPGYLMLVNGQSQPVLTVKDGKWQRFRFLFVASEQSAVIYMEEKHKASCGNACHIDHIYDRICAR